MIYKMVVVTGLFLASAFCGLGFFFVPEPIFLIASGILLASGFFVSGIR